jgi:membrane fusion protein, multidrug efflux system
MKHQQLLAATLSIAIITALSACSGTEKAVEKPLVLATQAQSASADVQIFSGEVRARQEVNLAFRVPGKIANRYVDSGARVQAGQILARLDDQDLSLQSQAANSSVDALKADRDLAQSELRRYRELAAKQLVSKSMFDSKLAQANSATSRYQQAVSQSKVNSNQASYALIRAPGPGVISKRYLEAGQVVAAGQTVFTFAADGTRDISITVAEQHLPNLKLGQAVSVELWTQPGTKYSAKIREIAGSADELTRTYAVRVALDDSDAPTQLGQSARVLFSNAQSSTLAVPLSALTELNGKPAVWVIDKKNARIHKRAVSVSRYGAQVAEIRLGLAQNDWIVQAGVHLLRENEMVQAVDRDNRPLNIGAVDSRP